MRLSSLHFATLCLLLGAGLAVGASPAAGAGNVSLYQVPEDVDPRDGGHADDAGAAAAAVEDGTAEPAGKLVAGDRLVVVVDSERLAADLEARNGSTTERFFAALDGEADLQVVQTNPPPERSTKRSRLGPGNATVHRNGSTVYALVDTGELTFERSLPGENEPEPLYDGERYAFTFGYDLDEFAADGPVVELYTTPSEFRTVSTTWYDPLPPERVSRTVKVNVEPEDGIVARVALDDGRTVTDSVGPVGWSGNPGVSLDLRDVEPGTAYAVELVHDGDVADRYEGTVREPTATVTDVTVTEVDNWTAVDATATLSHGGEVRVLNEDGERLGWTSVPPGNETDVSIRLRGSAEKLVVRAARESGASEEFYAGAETSVDFSDRQLRDPLATETETPTATPTATETATETPTETESDEGSPGDEQPGFGAGVAVAALLAAALLASRRA